MSKESDFADKKQIVESQFLQIYESLPVPQNNKQFTELLEWISKDRDKVFAHAKFSEISRRTSSFLMLTAGGIILYLASDRLESIKWFLKLLTPFIK